MNKNELIEKAVAQLNGEWPKLIAPWENFVHYKTEVLMGIEWLFSAPDGCHLCTREEFNAAADRMRGKPDWSTLPAKAEWLAQDRCGIWKPMQGRKPTIEEGSYWVTDHHLQPQPRGTVIGDWRNTLEKRPEQKADPLNGYLWGVDYVTNYKRPNLPDGLWVTVDLFNCTREIYLGDSAESGNFWVYSKSFKITDQRYKPDDPEPEPAPAKPWFEAGELPPAGTFVDVVGFVVYGIGEKNCEVIAHVENCAVIRMSYGLGCFQAECLKPSMTDKEKAIDAACSTVKDGNQHLLAVFEQLYDAGLLRLPDQK